MSDTLSISQHQQEDHGRSLLAAMHRIDELEQQLRMRVLAAEDECAALQQQHTLMRDFCEKERTIAQRLKEENSELKKAAEEAHRHRAQLERVILFLRERAEGAKIESINLQQEMQKILQDTDVTKIEISTLTQQLAQEQKEKTETQDELQLLRLQLSQLKQGLQVQVDQLQAEHIVLQQEKLQFQEALSIAEGDRRQAQQHLARKLKEVTYVNEKNEEYKFQLSDLQESLIQSHAKVAMLQQGVDLQLQHERQLHEQVKENFKQAEAQSRKWEEKYFQLQEQGKELEAQNRNLRMMEDRYNQLQTIFNNLSSIVGTPHLPGNGSQQSNVPPDNSVKYKQTIFD